MHIFRGVKKTTIVVIALGFLWAAFGVAAQPSQVHAQTKTVSGDKTNYDDESGIADWEIRIYEGTDSDLGTEEASTTTDQNGDYSLTVDPVSTSSSYLVCEEDKSGWNQTDPTLGELTAECPNGTIGHVISGSDDWSTLSSIDFTNEYIGTSAGGGGDILEPRNEESDESGEIAGTKRDYHNEAGLSGWEIRLHEFWSQSDGFDEDPEMTTTTMADDPETDTNEAGDYRFAHVPAGDYLVCEEDRPGWTQTDPVDGEQTYECENGTVGYIVTVDTDGSVESGHDFMNREGSDGGSVTGTKRSYDTEAGLPGWEVSLHDFWSESDGYDEDPVMTTTTRQDNPETSADESGMYRFDDVSAGDYLACEENRGSWEQTAPTSGENTYQCENGTTGHLVTVAEPGDQDTGNDFMNEEGPDYGGGEECGQYYSEDGEYYGEEGEVPQECEDWGDGEECQQYYEEGAEYEGEEGELPPECEESGGGEPDGGSADSPDPSSSVGFPDTGDGSLQLWNGPSK